MSQQPTLESKLRRSWPDVERGNNTKFWGDEWDKHGKCSEQTFNQVRYFDRSHEMWESYNITDILRRAGIVPGSTPWSYTTITNPIQTATKHTPLLRCKNVPANPANPQGPKNQLLHEVVFCYNPNGIDMINCTYTTSSVCKQNLNLFFTL